MEQGHNKFLHFEIHKISRYGFAVSICSTGFLQIYLPYSNEVESNYPWELEGLAHGMNLISRKSNFSY